MDQNGFFSKIDNPEELDQVLAAIELEHVTVTCKTEDQQQTLVLQVDTFKAHQCHLDFVSGTRFSQPIVVVASFELKSERYFARGRLVPAKAAQFAFEFIDVYKVQRRDAFRIPLKHDSKVFAKLSGPRYRGEQGFSLVDLSAGGFGFDWQEKSSAAKFEISDKLISEIVFPDRPSLKINIQVRSLRPVGNEGAMRVGCEFVELSPGQPEKLMALAMEIHRTMFARLK